MAEAAVQPVSIQASYAASYVEWGPIIAGAVLAAALSFVLLTFGTGIGLSLLSPYSSHSYGRAAASIAALWGLIVPIGSLLAGGYIAGRMRAPREGADEAEAEFRDRTPWRARVGRRRPIWRPLNVLRGECDGPNWLVYRRGGGGGQGSHIRARPGHSALPRHWYLGLEVAACRYEPPRRRRSVILIGSSVLRAIANAGHGVTTSDTLAAPPGANNTLSSTSSQLG